MRREQEKINQIAHKYSDFSKAAGLKTKTERMSVSGYRRVKTKAEVDKAKAKNYSKATDIFDDYDTDKSNTIKAEDVFNSLKTSKIGNEYLSYAENLPDKIKLDYTTKNSKVYGENIGNSIVIYVSNTKNKEMTARTVIHELTHYKYGIGQSQWAECVCYAHELIHKYNRNLTIAEKRRIIKAVKGAYSEYNWRRGGIINGRRKSH